jgi:L-threonylcarbamoyladenylate synthase
MKSSKIVPTLKIKDENAIKIVAEYLIDEKIGVLPTDTIYGIVCSAFDIKSVEKLYFIRKREKDKPMIILISDIKDLELFGIKINDEMKNEIMKFWPGKISIIFELDNKNSSNIKAFSYLHRDKNSLAFRLPKKLWLRNLLKIVGPMVAPSANISNKLPAKNIKEAKKYFGDSVDFYLDAGDLISEPSKLIKIENGKIIILRK